MFHILFIHSSVGGPLGYFHLLSVVSNAAVNTSELVQDPDFRFLSLFSWSWRVGP